MITRSFSLVVLSGLLIGCGGSDAEVLPVVKAAGTVKAGDLPLDGATVVLAPQDGGKYVGTALTEAGGAFSVTMNNQSGALPGTYKVIVTKSVFTEPKLDSSGHEESPGQSKLLTPMKYSSLETTDLTITVPPEGSETLEIKLNP